MWCLPFAVYVKPEPPNNINHLAGINAGYKQELVHGLALQESL